MNLEQFANRKVTVILRNSFIETGELKIHYHLKDLKYPYSLNGKYYSNQGEFLNENLNEFDIISIQPTEELKMTEPNYKELASDLYDAFKDNYQVYGNISPKQSAILEKYEKFHKPKLTYVSCIAGDKFVYGGKDYALIDGFWYRVQKCVLTLVEDNNLKSELIDAYYEWEKNK